MTTESLKSFITLPTTTIYKKGGGTHQKAKLFCFSLFLTAFCVTVSCYQIWNFLRTNELRTEVDQLRDKLESMRKRMGLEMFDDLDEFENVYAPHLEGDGGDGDIFSDDLNDFDEDIEDEEYDEVYDLDSDMMPEDDDDNIEIGSGLQKFYNNDDYESYQSPESNKRVPRDVPVHVSSSVPIIEESYAAVRRNKTNSGPAMDHLTELLLKRSASPKMHYDWDQKSKERAPGATPSGHQSPRRHVKKYLEHRGPPTLYVTRQAAGAAAATADDHPHNAQPQIHIRHNNHHQQHQQQMRTQHNANREIRQKYQEPPPILNAAPLIGPPKMMFATPQPIHVRESRVMATNEDKSKAFRQTITKREYARLKALQSPDQFVESVAHPEMFAHQPRRLTRKSGTSKVARQVSSRPRLIAVQFNGDTSRYDAQHHSHYQGNGFLRHEGGVYHDWTTAPWVNSLRLDKYFSMDAGVVTVRENGLYYIYAQIYYKDEHDTNGFEIMHNDNAIMQCATMTHTNHSVSKTNTCHTGSVAFLRAGDTVRVADLGHSRKVILKAGQSFFGLIKLAGLQQYSQQQGLTDSPTMSPNEF